MSCGRHVNPASRKTASLTLAISPVLRMPKSHKLWANWPDPACCCSSHASRVSLVANTCCAISMSRQPTGLVGSCICTSPSSCCMASSRVDLRLARRQTIDGPLRNYDHPQECEASARLAPLIALINGSRASSVPSTGKHACSLADRPGRWRQAHGAPFHPSDKAAPRGSHPCAGGDRVTDGQSAAC